MAIRNNHWYNLNEQRYYPLDDTASATSDAGEILPSTLIADLRLRWPDSYGAYAFVSSAAITPHLITVLIEVAPQRDSNAGSRLIAGVTVLKSSLIPGRAYPLTTFQPGVGGFIVIGAGTDQLFSGRFSLPSQGLLTPRAARPTRQPPVTTIGLERTADSLSGLVNLVAVAPLTLKREPRMIDGQLQENVIVFSLSQDANELIQTATTESVFSQFAGPCGQRVGSKSCSDPQPIQTINGVEPDCDGVLTLDFKGCAVIGRNTADCGIVVDCYLGLSDSCEPGYLPDLDTGLLPIEHAPTLIPPVVTPDPDVPPDVSITIPPVVVLSLPYCDTFEFSNPTEFPAGFSVMGTSVMGYAVDGSPAADFCCTGPPPADPSTAYGCFDASISESAGGALIPNPILPLTPISFGTVNTRALSQTNIALFTLDVQSLYRTFSTDVKLVSNFNTPGGVRAPLNAGVVVNYRINSQGLVNYVLAQIDLDIKAFGVYFFNGVNLVSLGTVPLDATWADEWNRIQISVAPNALDYTMVRITAKLTPITRSGYPPLTIHTSLLGYLWGTDAANSGFYARRSLARFSYWRVEEGEL